MTDLQWRELQPLIPPAHAGGRPRRVDMREILCGIFYVLQNGGAWSAMPHDLPSGKTCWFYFNRFSSDGTWERIARRLYPAARARADRDPEPSEAVIDAQSVKTTKKGGRRVASVTMQRRRSLRRGRR